MTEDIDLVTASMTGDVRAFGRLVERHHGAVTSVAFAVTRDIAVSEDIAQETFVIAWTRLGELRDPARVRAWLCNIARNKSKNELRARDHQVELSADPVDAAPSAIDHVLAREAEAQLRSALAEIPDAYREPLVLFYWEEQSIERVASALDITEQAAQKRISRARSFVHEELATRFSDAGKTRRSAKVAATAIVAVLATRAAPAAAGAGSSKLGSVALVAIKLAAVLATCLVVGLAAWRIAARGASASPSDRREAHGTAQQPTVATSHAPAAPTLAGSAQVPATTRTGESAPEGNFGNPASYEVTVLAPTRVGVALAGGRTTTYVPSPTPAPAFQRHVRGHVLDGTGKPVAGAVVVVGDDMRVWHGTLMGDAGVATDASGAFDAIVYDDKPLSAIALHARIGWSTTIAVPAGKSDAEIELRVARGGVSGTVRRGGAPVEATVYVKTDALMIELETDDSGRFDLPLLGPGRYHVSAHATQLFAGGASVGAERDVVLDAGKPTNLALELPTGVLVVVTAADAGKLSTIEYYLVPGNEPGLDAAKLRELGRSGKAMETLFGGQDVDQPMQFHDLSPGTYTLCIDRKPDRDHHLPLACKALAVPAGKPVFEVEL